MRRAYILLEALVGGALVAMVVGALYVQAGYSHAKIVQAARRTQAAHIAQVALAQQAQRGFFHLVASGPEVVTAGGAHYTRRVTISAENTFGGVHFKDVIVDVDYQVAGNEQNVHATSRVWAP